MHIACKIYALLFCNFLYFSKTQCHKFLTNCQNLHSLIITREGLILTLSILITLPGGIFGCHLVSKNRFTGDPLCREWIRKSSTWGRDFPILSLQRIEQLSSHNEHTFDNSLLVRQPKVQTIAGRQ